MEVRSPMQRKIKNYRIKLVVPFLFFRQCSKCKYEFRKTTLWRYRVSDGWDGYNYLYGCTTCFPNYDDVIKEINTKGEPMKFETPRITTIEEFTHAVIGIVRTITIHNGEEWTPFDQIKEMLAARDAAIRKECAERAIAWRHKKYSCTVPGVDEELFAAIIGKEGEE